MIINDARKFAFIHIPKCAGTSVRGRLERYDDLEGAHTGRVGEHKALGRIDYVHIPIFVLRQYFTDKYVKLLTYNTYAVVRSPFDRFPSSFCQHLKRYGKRSFQEMMTSEFKQAMDEALDFLSANNAPKTYLPYQYVHFQRQVDFVYDHGQRIVNNIYPVTGINRMLVDIEQQTGWKLREAQTAAATKVNETVFYRNSVARVMAESARPILRLITSERQRQRLREATRSVFYVARDRGLGDIFESEYVNDFVADYYRDDIQLFQDVLGEAELDVHEP